MNENGKTSGREDGQKPVLQSSRLLVFLFTLVLGHAHAADQLPSDWNAQWGTWAGRPGGIPTTNGWTIVGLGNGTTRADINTAISSASGPTVIYLTNDVQLTLSGGSINFSRNDIRIRGLGAWRKQILFTNCGSQALFAMTGSGFAIPPTYNRNWTAGYTKGDSNLTFSSVANLSVGDMVFLTQTADNDHLVNGHGDEGDCDYCAGFIDDTDKTQQLHAKVAAINGSIVTIWPPLIGTNWSSTYNPQAYYMDTTRTNVGIEELGWTNASACKYSVEAMNVSDFWLDGIWSDMGSNAHVKTLHCALGTVRRSLLSFTFNHATESYGFAPYNVSWFDVQDSVTFGVTGPWKATSASGNVFAYNYVTNQFYSNNLATDTNWLIGSASVHGTHCYQDLFEGNYVNEHFHDFIHGSSSHQVLLRERSDGRETNRVNNSHAIGIQATNRYYAVMGCVLGTYGFHTNYQSAWPDTTANDHVRSIWELGYGDNNYNYGDAAVESTLLRHYNWDTVTAAITATNNGLVTCCGYGNSDVPTNSYLYSSRPAFFGNEDWPPFGPEYLERSTNHATIRLPAKLRFEAAMAANNMQLFFTPLTTEGAIVPAVSTGRTRGRKLLAP